MKSDLIYIFLAFIEGFSLISSPCILPILPIFLAGSLGDSKKRPLGIIVGFTVFFALIAFFSRKFVHYTGIDLNLLRHISFGVLIVLGVIMLSNYLSEKFAQLSQYLVNAGSFLNLKKQGTGFLNGLFFGGLVAIIWTPCAGPILASVIVQTVLQKTTFLSFLILLAFSLGAAIPMFIIAFYGKKFLSTFNFFKSHTSLVRRSLGAIIILSVCSMMYFEDSTAAPTNTQTEIKTSFELRNGLWINYPAPQIEGIKAWINSSPLTIQELKGKVILVDFWTYSCINCIRTLPYLKDWYAKYRDKGLVIIGVHTPEFAFESKLENVQKAVQRNQIVYPVALDNQFTTWTNFNNHYWPAHYLIDKKGDVVYTHFGEGQYAITENNIRFLLGIKEVPQYTQQVSEANSLTQTPETYFGYTRADNYLSPKLIKDKPYDYQFPASLPLNAWGLNGNWQVHSDSLLANKKDAALKIHFNAGKVFAVLGNNTGKPIKVSILLNGEQLIVGAGHDVHESSVLVDRDSIYELVSLKGITEGYLQLIATEPGIQVYTCTFGS